MLINALRALARFRRPILVAELILAVAYLVVEPVLPWWLPAGLILAGFVLGLYANLRYRPAMLTARPGVPAFDTPVNPDRILICTAYLIFATDALADAGHGLAERSEGWQWDVGTAGFVLLALSVLLAAAWGRLGVRLRPDGLIDRQAAGSLFVPWAALDPGYPPVPAGSHAELALRYQRAELVRRRGVIAFGRQAIVVRNTDRSFLAEVIRHYLLHPEDRAAIGSEAELRRFSPPVSEPAARTP